MGLDLCLEKEMENNQGSLGSGAAQSTTAETVVIPTLFSSTGTTERSG